MNAEEIKRAYERIRGSVTATPLRRSHILSDLCGCEMLLKMETLQMTGAFKERGALNRLLLLSEQEKERGVIAASAGNHAQGVAYHAKRMGLRAVIVMPEATPLVKVSGVQFWGAEVILHGRSYDEAYAHSRVLEKERGLVYVHPFADPHVIAGQGTIALEILNHECAEGLDAIVVPIGGGGLAAGIATYAKAVCPGIKIIGVEVEGFSAMKDSLARGAVETLPPGGTIADGIAVRRVSETTFDLCREWIDEIVTVDDDEIANGILTMLEYEKVVVEGAGAAAVSALMNRRVGGLAGKKVAAIVSGGNIDINILSRIIDRGLEFSGRVAHFSTRLRDMPGELESVISIFREAGGNILEVFQHRFAEGVRVGDVNVSFTIETRNRAHIAEIQQQLRDRGYELFRTRWDPA